MEMMPFIAAWFQLEIIILSEVNQKEKDKYHMISLICVWILNSDTNEPICETETDPWTWKTDVVPKGWEAGVSRCKLLYIERTDEILLCSTGNYTQYAVINRSGKEYKKKNMCVCIYICVCVTESLCCTAEINTAL